MLFIGSLEIEICQVTDNKDNDWCHNEIDENLNAIKGDLESVNRIMDE